MLITCPECGNKISDKAECCPHCGCPVESLFGDTDRYDIVLTGYKTPNADELDFCVFLVSEFKLSTKESAFIITHFPYIFANNLSKPNVEKLKSILDRSQIQLSVRKTETLIDGRITDEDVEKIFPLSF